MTFRKRASRFFGLLLRLAYLFVCTLCVGILVWVIRRQHSAEVGDADQVYMLLFPVTAPIGWLGAAIFELAFHSIDIAIGQHALGRYPVLGAAQALLEALFVSGLGYWQWFWLLPRLWLRLKWGRDWKYHIRGVEDDEGMVSDEDNENAAD